MLNAQAFLPLLIGRQQTKTYLGANACHLCLCSPFVDRKFRVKTTGFLGVVLPRVFLWAHEGELKVRPDLGLTLWEY